MPLRITRDSKIIKGTLTSGVVYDAFTNEDVIPYGCYKGNEEFKEIIIPERITSIDSEAFMDCSSLTTVTIPESLQRIDVNAFIGCTALKQIILPASLNEVEVTLDGRGVSNIRLHKPSSDKLINLLKQGHAMDLYHEGDYRDDFWD